MRISPVNYQNRNQNQVNGYNCNNLKNSPISFGVSTDASGLIHYSDRGFKSIVFHNNLPSGQFEGLFKNVDGKFIIYVEPFEDFIRLFIKESIEAPKGLQRLLPQKDPEFYAMLPAKNSEPFTVDQITDFLTVAKVRRDVSGT